jgi:legumain
MKSSLLLLFGACCVYAENWAVIVVGSKGYSNYRHHADGCHAYQIMKKNGIPESNIILMMQDDVANAEENPYPGKLFNKPTKAGEPGVDVYQGCKPTYTGDGVTAKLFLDVIQGKSSSTAHTVLKSTSDDSVFINFVDHGGVGIVELPNGPMLKNTELVAALKAMHSSKMYKQLVFYMEACESGSMFATLPAGLNIYATTAANAKESSWGTYCSPNDQVDGKKMNTCLGDLYSVNWMEDSDNTVSMQSETLEKQFQLVKKETNKSHCLEFGDVKSLSSLPIHDFMAEQSAVFDLANSSQRMESDNMKLESAVDSRDAQLVSKFYQYLNGGDSSSAASALIKEIEMREQAKLRFKQIASLVGGSEAVAGQLLGPHTELQTEAEWSCHHSAIEAVEAACGRFNDVSLKYIATIANMCQAGISVDVITKAAKQVC